MGDPGGATWRRQNFEKVADQSPKPERLWTRPSGDIFTFTLVDRLGPAFYTWAQEPWWFDVSTS